MKIYLLLILILLCGGCRKKVENVEVWGKWETNNSETDHDLLVYSNYVYKVVENWKIKEIDIKALTITNDIEVWMPKIGDRVQTHYRPDGWVGSNRTFITTITNIIYVGDRSQTGFLVYGDGLPGIDSWWVLPAQ